MTPRIDELIALAALGELDGDGWVELDDAAAADPEIARQLDEALETAATLQAHAAVAPPGHLKAAVMAQIAHVSAPPQAVVAQLDERRKRRNLMPLLAAAALVLVVAGGAIALSRPDSGSDRIAAVVDADDAVVRVLDMPPSNTVEVIYSPSHNAVVVEADDMPLLSDAQTYQLWLIEGDQQPVPAGLLRPNDDGELRARIDDIDPSGQTLAITVEPAGGSALPTSDPLAVG